MRWAFPRSPPETQGAVEPRACLPAVMLPFFCTEQLCVDTLDSSDFETFECLPRSLIIVFKYAEKDYYDQDKPAHKLVSTHPLACSDAIGRTVPLVFWIICCSPTLTLTLIAALEWPQIPCKCGWPWLVEYAYFKSRTKMKRKKKEWGKDMKAWKLH